MSAIEAIAQKIFDFKSTATSCLMWRDILSRAHVKAEPLFPQGKQ